MVILTDQEIVFEIEDETSIIEVSKAAQGLFHWGGQSIALDSVVALQQMIEILEKVSEQVKEVENICSGSMPVLDREYYTPPVSQARVS